MAGNVRNTLPFWAESIILFSSLFFFELLFFLVRTLSESAENHMQYIFDYVLYRGLVPMTLLLCVLYFIILMLFYPFFKIIIRNTTARILSGMFLFFTFNVYFLFSGYLSKPQLTMYYSKGCQYIENGEWTACGMRIVKISFQSYVIAATIILALLAVLLLRRGNLGAGER